VILYWNKKRGSILVLALWTVVLLSVFAVQMGLRIRQRATLLSRIESRNKLRAISEAAVKKAISTLRQDLNRNQGLYSAYGKFYRHNHPDKFSLIDLGVGKAQVFYSIMERGREQKVYGLVDEERKININHADKNILTRIITQATGHDEQSSQKLAEAIIEWREYGQTELKGFYSEEFYSTQQYPYEPKHAEFETLDELLLARGFQESIIEKLRPLVTVYGDGMININTAPREVLMALGLEETVADKLLVVRRGYDEQESTVDDYLFTKTFDVAVEMKNFVKLELAEVKQIDELNQRALIKTESSVYSIQAQAHLEHFPSQMRVFCVYSPLGNKILYWREKFMNSFEQ
jgi:general secretion pathway protein K